MLHFIFLDLSPSDVQQIEACAALLLATIIFRRLSKGMRIALFLLIGSAGVLAAISGAASHALSTMFD
jgi:hypothetical protein